MKTRTRTLSNQQQSWAASSIDTIELPPDRYIGEALLEFDFTYDTASSPSVNEDGVLEGVDKIELVVNGKVKRSWDPARYWYFLPLDLPADPELVDATTTVANDKNARFVLPMYFRADAGNDDDYTALLPAHYLSSVEIRIHWAAADAFGTNQTITAGTCDVTLKEYEFTPSEEMELYGVSGREVVQAGSDLIELLEHEQQTTVSASASNFGFEIDLPTGSVLTRSALFVVDNSVRDDDLLTEYEVKRVSPFTEEFFQETWSMSQIRDKQEYGIVNPIEGNRYLTGLTMLDYADLEAPLDLRDDRRGAVKFRATVGSPTSTANVTFVHQSFNEVSY